MCRELDVKCGDASKMLELKEEKKSGEEMIAVVIVLAAKYSGLFHGPVILGGQVL